MLLLRAREIKASQVSQETSDSVELLGKIFVKVHAHQSLADAITACRTDLELGHLSVVVEDTCEVWMHFPRSFKLPSYSINAINAN